MNDRCLDDLVLPSKHHVNSYALGGAHSSEGSVLHHNMSNPHTTNILACPSPYNHFMCLQLPTQIIYEDTACMLKQCRHHYRRVRTLPMDGRRRVMRKFVYKYTFFDGINNHCLEGARKICCMLSLAPSIQCGNGNGFCWDLPMMLANQRMLLGGCCCEGTRIWTIGVDTYDGCNNLLLE